SGHARAAVADDRLGPERTEGAVTLGEVGRGVERPPWGTKVAGEGGRARSGDVAWARVDGLGAAFEALGGARIEEDRAGPAAEAIDLGLVHDPRRGREVERRSGRDHRQIGGERPAGGDPRAEAPVEDATAAVTEPAQQPPEARRDGAPRVVVGDDHGLAPDAEPRE